MTIVGGVSTSAHRRDEYLQAARIAVEPDAVRIELDLTPGIEMAAAVIADIDSNRDGSLSIEERRAYSNQVLSALQVEVDGKPLQVELADSGFPETEAMRRGEGTIRLQLATTVPGQSTGTHQVLFRNNHHRDSSVYLANALVPTSDRVAVTGQRRVGDQSELTIDYVMRAPAETSLPIWLLSGIAAGAIGMLGLRRGNSTGRGGDSCAVPGS